MSRNEWEYEESVDEESQTHSSSQYEEYGLIFSTYNTHND